MIFQSIVLIISAYLLGSIPAAYLIVKWTRGVDIRTVGTGKAGASNVLKAGPKWAVIPVVVFDIGKGALVVWAAKLLGLSIWIQVIAGLAAIVGHNWPVYLGFKAGGRGVLASLGVIFMLSWKIGLFALIFPYLFAPAKQLALGVFIAYLALTPLTWFVGGPYEEGTRVPIMLGILAITIIGLTRRLIATRSELSKQKPWSSILINRLLFDRDIRDRNLWLTREAVKSNG